MASQFRIVSSKKSLWLCDNQAVQHFLDATPPNNPHLRRWFLFLSKFPLKIVQISGFKNELCDFLSRGSFNSKVQMSTEKLAEGAFARMDAQIDPTLQVLSVLYFYIPPTLRRETYDTDLPDI